MVYGDPVSFVDKLMEQMGERELTSRQQEILEYLIGSLDDDGLLRISLDSIADKLSIYQGLDVEEKEVELMLLVLQDFDPPGIGARSLQECLLLQVHRKQRALRPVNTEEKRPWHSSITSSIPSYRMTGTPSPRSDGTSCSSS